jgi:hypothetical protein
MLLDLFIFILGVAAGTLALSAGLLIYTRPRGGHRSIGHLTLEEQGRETDDRAA